MKKPCYAISAITKTSKLFAKVLENLFQIMSYYVIQQCPLLNILLLNTIMIGAM